MTPGKEAPLPEAFGLHKRLRYLRHESFYALLRPFSRHMRERRWRQFEQLMRPAAQGRVLDLGGTPDSWPAERLRRTQLQVELLNLPAVTATSNAPLPGLRVISGDACETGLPDGYADIVYSNSVIEHVGDRQRRAAFAREVRRLGRAYWVQTPSVWFPIEAHTGVPFWWWLPARVRSAMIRRWRRKLPAWSEMVAGTTVVGQAELRELFPDATLMVERFLGLPKSYVAFRRPPAQAAG